MFGSTFEMHFLNYESQKGKNKISKVGHQKKLKKKLFFCKVLNENENIKTLMFPGKRQRKLPRITPVNVL